MRRILFAGLLSSVLLACGGPNNPGEMPPLAPRPDPVEPTPIGGVTPEVNHAPVPGAPDPLAPKSTPDAKTVTLTEIPVAELAASEETIPLQKPTQTPDAGITGGDASAPLPPVPDAVPMDASRTVP